MFLNKLALLIAVSLGAEGQGASAASVSFDALNRSVDTTRFGFMNVGCISDAPCREVSPDIIGTPWEKVWEMPGARCECCDPRDYGPFQEVAASNITSLWVRSWREEQFANRAELERLVHFVLAMESATTKGYFYRNNNFVKFREPSFSGETRDASQLSGELFVWGSTDSGHLAFQTPMGKWLFAAWGPLDRSSLGCASSFFIRHQDCELYDKLLERAGGADTASVVDHEMIDD